MILQTYTLQTVEGDIPHIQHKGFRLCVALEAHRTYAGMRLKTDGKERSYPERKNGKLVYALPGGGRVVI